MKFYHLTTESNEEGILECGLDPSFSCSSLTAIFLAGSKSTAENYACMKDESCVILEVDLPDELCALLIADNYELRDAIQEMDARTLKKHDLWVGAQSSDCSWVQSLEICDQVACPVAIPPEFIRRPAPSLRL